MPHLLPTNLSDHRDVNFPAATGHSFWLRGGAWDYPSFSNAEAFVARLARRGLIVRNPIVDSMLAGDPDGVSLRTAQRRFLQATGLTQRAVRQIERARQATSLLKAGVCRFYTKQRRPASRMMRAWLNSGPAALSAP
jgi:hypothetical protein